MFLRFELSPSSGDVSGDNDDDDEMMVMITVAMPVTVFGVVVVTVSGQIHVFYGLIVSEQNACCRFGKKRITLNFVPDLIRN
ncbi:hypothetical protein HanLR1_Chr14g0536121 [Helianthus annuus]|nr:hypothetical protein HanHA89_Chr14g0573721 [Helianthus annuus]KAJ0656466.1 hypothetical protein HanLR1_Chr14g0536121 [Helianthus annuus]